MPKPKEMILCCPECAPLVRPGESVVTHGRLVVSITGTQLTVSCARHQSVVATFEVTSPVSVVPATPDAVHDTRALSAEETAQALGLAEIAKREMSGPLFEPVSEVFRKAKDEGKCTFAAVLRYFADELRRCALRAEESDGKDMTVQYEEHVAAAARALWLGHHAKGASESMLAHYNINVVGMTHG